TPDPGLPGGDPRRGRARHGAGHARTRDRCGVRTAPRAAGGEAPAGARRTGGGRARRGGCRVTGPAARAPHISASILNADFAQLGSEVRRATDGGVDSIHLDVMDGHFVPNISMGPVVVEAVPQASALPFHSHLMISEPLRYVDAFANAGSDVIVFHMEADGDPHELVERIHRTGRGAGLAINPETPGEAAHPYLAEIDLLLVMTVHPGFGGQDFMSEVLPKLRSLRAEVERRR